VTKVSHASLPYFFTSDPSQFLWKVWIIVEQLQMIPHRHAFYFCLLTILLQTGSSSPGSFTTFSTFSVDVVNWINQGKTVQAMSYVATNNIGGFLAAGIGMAVAKKFFG
jgi:fluoride ion exporter CrcB/FEX